jgi:formamidopyrimidine-DNA glycosylase
MPELPDIVIYIEALEKRILGRTLERAQIASPFLLRTAVPPISAAEGKKVVGLRRLGKRVCIGLEEDLWLVLHLMIAGRLHWKTETRTLKVRGSSGKSRAQLAAFAFDNGTLSLTEAGSKRRASLHVVEGEAGLRALDRGGLEMFQKPEREGGLGEFVDLNTFTLIIQSENHTLKRALTDPRLLSGIGNAYSDEILFAAQLSPIKLTQKLTNDELERLYTATQATLLQWIERLRAETGDEFPEKVTAFRDGMAVHGRFRQQCPRCGARIQRIRYATNETNYCPTCQTGGKLLADRALSRILREDWPRTAEDLA